MANFIKIKTIYNHLTAQGEGSKLINLDQIRYITDWAESEYKHRAGTKTVICLVTGEMLDTCDSLDEIENKIKKSKEIPQ